MNTHLPSTGDPSCAEPHDSTGRWRLAWDAALRGVEIDLLDAERLIERLHLDEDVPVDSALSHTWVVPDLQGPVPTEFADRARALLRRQSEVTERLTEAVSHVRAQRRVLGKLGDAESRPVFVDRAV